MKNCEDYEILISTWVDGQADRDEQVECLDHVARCAACRGFYLQARSLDGLVAAVRTPDEAVAPSPEVWKRIEWVTTKERRPAARRRIPAWALQAAAVVVVAVGLSVLMWNGGGEAPRPEQAEIALGGGTDMTESRFVELTREVLEADPRYHSALYEIMGQVVQDTAGYDEASSEEMIDRGDEGELDEGTESAGVNVRLIGAGDRT
jgi:hypothetical protein